MNSMTKKENSDGFMRIGLFICACVLFAAGIVLGFMSGAGPATATFATGVFCLIFAFLSRFKRFKGLGIEAELWEQKQEEAARLVETLRSLSVVASEQLVNLSARMGRLGTPVTRKELFDLVDRLEKVLSEVNVPADQREKMKADFYRFTAIDMAIPITKKIDDAIKRKTAEQMKVVESFGPEIKDLNGHAQAAERLKNINSQEVDWDRLRLLPPDVAMHDALENTISEADCLTEEERAELRGEIADEMADLREWVTNRRLRRPELWLAGDSA